jgi:branched-chain amino acid transport system ATP-binding protein
MKAYALELINVHKSFGITPIIRGVTLGVIKGERHAIIGPNGAGKSTLFNLITGKYPLSAGMIKINSIDITGFPPFEIYRKGLSRSFQVINIFHRMTVYENIQCSILWSLGYKYSIWHSVGRLNKVRERTEEILEKIGMTSRKDIPAGELSYAEQRALEIGITIAGGANLILLDEPTAGMNRSETEHAVSLIRNISEGRTLIIVEHDMSVVFSLADRISVLVYGEILATDEPNSIRQNRNVQEAYLGMEGI